MSKPSIIITLALPPEVMERKFVRSIRGVAFDNILPMYQKVIDGFAAAGGEKDVPIAMLGVRKEYLDAACDGMEKNDGMMENYFSKGSGGMLSIVNGRSCLPART
jgi:hypothetical protein